MYMYMMLYSVAITLLPYLHTAYLNLFLHKWWVSICAASACHLNVMIAQDVKRNLSEQRVCIFLAHFTACGGSQFACWTSGNVHGTVQ